MSAKYSPSLNTFFLAEFMSRYEQAGTLPDDAIDVSEATFYEYSAEPPEGMMRKAGIDGMPLWGEIMRQESQAN